MSTSETDKQQKSPAAPPEPNKTVMPTRKLVAPPEAAVPAKLAGVALYVTDLEARKNGMKPCSDSGPTRFMSVTAKYLNMS